MTKAAGFRLPVHLIRDCRLDARLGNANVKGRGGAAELSLLAYLSLLGAFISLSGVIQGENFGLVQYCLVPTVESAIPADAFDFKGVSITDFAGNIYCKVATDNGRKLHLTQRFDQGRNKTGVIARTKRGTGWHDGSRIDFLIGKLLNGDLNPIPDFVSGGLAAILNLQYYLKRFGSAEIMNASFRKGQIGPQFSLGMFLARPPQKMSGDEQTYREEGHYHSAKGNYLGIVFSNKLQKLFDAVIAGFLLFGLLIGLLLLFFVNAWIGRAFLISWLLSFLYVLSGAWMWK